MNHTFFRFENEPARSKELWRDGFGFILLALCVTLILLGCGANTPAPQLPSDNSAPGSESPTAVPPTESAPGALSANLKATVEDGQLPNQFTVRLSWTASESRSPWLLFRSIADGANGKQAIATLSGDATNFSDSGVSAGGQYTYVLTTEDSGTVAEVAQTSVSVPKDLVMAGVQNVSGSITAHRLFLNSASLYTNGAPLTITVDELIAHGTIFTYPVFRAIFASPVIESAPIGESGRYTGPIILRAKSATGELTLFATGEAGGAGRPGTPGSPGAHGNPHPFPNNEVMAFCPNLRCACYTGGPGGNGGPGAIGGEGGESPHVFVQIGETKDFQFHPLIQPGPGGPGGAGGTGGAGGAPATAREISNLPPSPDDYPVGNVGPAGAAGATGPAGVAGHLTPYCLELSGKQSAGCSYYDANGNFIK